MLKLYIVDDEWTIREGLSKTVPWEDWGIQCVGTARNGTEALDYLHHHPVDILLTDIRMPGIDGLDLIEAVKSINSEIKIIILTGHNEFTYAQRAIKLDADDFLLKPTNFDELEKTIKNLVSHLHSDKDKQTELLSIYMNNYITSSTITNRQLLAETNYLQPHYAILKLEFPINEANNIDIENAILFKRSKDDMYYLLHSVTNLTALELFIKELAARLVTLQVDMNIYVSLLTDDLTQIVELYRQANTAHELSIDNSSIKVYYYFDNTYSSSITDALAYIDTHYMKSINQNDMAQQFNMSNSYFSRLFKQHTGKNFVDYLTTKRIDVAKQLLRSTDLKIYEIAETIGYSESRYFNQLFKRITNCTPSEYRGIHK